MPWIHDDFIGDVREPGRKRLDHLLHGAVFEIRASETTAQKQRIAREENAVFRTVQANGTFGMPWCLDDREDLRANRKLIAFVQVPVDMRCPIAAIKIVPFLTSNAIDKRRIRR